MQLAGSAGDEHDNTNAKPDGRHVIFRQNYLWDGVDAAMVTATHDDFVDDSLGEIKVYNNTMYGNGRIMDIRSAGGFVFDDSYMYCDFINNICDEIMGSFKTVALAKHFRRQATGEPTEGFADGWKGGRYSANIAKMAATAPEGSTVTIEFRNFGGLVEQYNWTTVDNTYPGSWTSDNVMGTSPTYQGTPASGARTKATFLPNGGIETGNAVAHAFADGGSGGFSTTLTVDAGGQYMFKDDWGMSALGVSGDYIKIGSGEPVQITGVNTSTRVYTIASVREWSDNDEVFWCTTDDGVNFTVFQDIGAGQTPATVTPVTPVHSTKVMVFR